MHHTWPTHRIKQHPGRIKTECFLQAINILPHMKLPRLSLIRFGFYSRSCGNMPHIRGHLRVGGCRRRCPLQSLLGTSAKCVKPLRASKPLWRLAMINHNTSKDTAGRFGTKCPWQLWSQKEATDIGSWSHLCTCNVTCQTNSGCDVGP